MTVQTITPSSKQDWLKARTEDITSTEVSALFGISPYTTAFELWHRKHDGFEVEKIRRVAQIYTDESAVDR